jgi:hypothetical protein
MHEFRSYTTKIYGVCIHKSLNTAEKREFQIYDNEAETTTVSIVLTRSWGGPQMGWSRIAKVTLFYMDRN